MKREAFIHDPGLTSGTGDDGDDAPPMWLTSFTDLVCLVLAFFVLLFAMSSPKEDMWRSVATSVSQRFSSDVSDPSNHDHTRFNISVAEIDLTYLYGVLHGGLANAPGAPVATVEQLPDRIVVMLPADLLFPPGSAQVSQQGAAALTVVGDVLSRIRNRIEVHGHADPNPVDSDGFRSNWDLSLARALSVAEALHQAGYERDIVTVGYGDSDYALMPTVLSRADRERLARRVDIVVRPDQAN